MSWPATLPDRLPERIGDDAPGGTTVPDRPRLIGRLRHCSFPLACSRGSDCPREAMSWPATLPDRLPGRPGDDAPRGTTVPDRPWPVGRLSHFSFPPARSRGSDGPRAAISWLATLRAGCPGVPVTMCQEAGLSRQDPAVGRLRHFSPHRAPPRERWPREAMSWTATLRTGCPGARSSGRARCMVHSFIALPHARRASALGPCSTGHKA